MGVEKMTALHCSVCVPNHHMRVNYGLSLIERDVAAHPNDLALTFNGNLFVHFALGIEPPQCCSIHRTSSGEVRTCNVVLFRELLQPRKGLASLVEDDRILLDRFPGIQQLNLHPGSLATGNGFRRRNIFAVCPLRMYYHSGHHSTQEQEATSRFTLLIDFLTLLSKFPLC
jgi:hypothetical protein